MLGRNYSLDPQDYSLIRKELSILDGLGDLFLAQETSKLIYELICQKTILILIVVLLINY